MDEIKSNIQPAIETVQKIKNEVLKAIIGQEETVNQLLIGLLTGGHILLEGVPGVAKTLMAKSLAASLAIKFKRIQFTPDLLPGDITGTSIFNPKSLDFEFREGPVFCNVLLIDEVNRAPAKTQAALFEVMEEKQITSDGFSRVLTAPFLVVATQNPIEHEGTYRLPEAQLDRFLLKVIVDYPNEKDEIEVLQLHNKNHQSDLSKGVNAVCQAQELIDAQQATQDVFVSGELVQYITALVRATRNFEGIYLGASTRAGIALLTASKAQALLNGNDYVKPDDVKKMIYPVMRHRILLSGEKEIEGMDADKMIELVLNKVQIPR